MLLKTTGYHVAAGVILFSLSIALAPQNAAAQGSTQVLTPFGYRDAANVHQIPDGYNHLIRMPDGHIRAVNPVTGAHIDFARPTTTAARKPFSDNGWITYASWLNQSGTPVSSFTTTWTVPKAPKAYHQQTLFQFNSIEPSSYDSILQPVLQYGPSAAGGAKYWAVASWYVTGNDAYYSSLVKVKAGQVLVGVITLTSQSGQNFTYSCEFTGISGTNFSIENISQLTWCTETLEVYGVSACNEFPNTAYSEMDDINVLTGGKTPSVDWVPTDVATSCGVQTTIVTNGGTDAAVDIYF
jgi:hypothetical protein